MKKTLINATYVSFIVAFFFIATIGCKSSIKETTKDFVYLEDDVFKINDTVFFPLMLNYKVDMRNADDAVVLSSPMYYENGGIYESNTKEEILQQFSNHLELMSELGFNTVRLCIDVVLKDKAGTYYPSSDGRISLTEDTEKILDGIADALDIAESHGLKVMLLLKPPFEKEVETFTIEMLKRFSDNPTIFAYDFMNEPLYFDTEPNRTKKDAVKIVSEWRDTVKKYAPNHLFTIGFSEPIEVFEWDPSMLPVDFVQIHTYHPLRIPSEIWWYSKYCNKPWIIGETALPADNDSISYEEQYHFAEEVYQYVIDCGGIGFGWWEFQDHINKDMNFEANYTGLLNHEGVTKTKSGNKIIGTLKPAAYQFKEFSKLKAQGPKPRPQNYYNMLGYENYVIKGRIECNNESVEGALIRGWNANWSVGQNTYSDENGNFTLCSNDSCTHFEISAPGLSKVKFDRNDLIYNRVDGKTHDFSDLENVKLEYHKINYQPFLKNDTTFFEFKEGLFDKAKFSAEMGTIKLKKL